MFTFGFFYVSLPAVSMRGPYCACGLFFSFMRLLLLSETAKETQKGRHLTSTVSFLYAALYYHQSCD